ncbi:unnamed protein product [Brachionus calyciflorus]|uniref:Reverse transcriptase domain-containing protein n=1 Tax=Brachionus calyciflorus TaxID=104777 RepID=A0A814JPP8_9BILA|nr:unnamed protein product [Brachionus calyciflorus]
MDKNNENIPIQKETLKFRDLLYNNIFLNKDVNFSPNLTNEQIQDLLFFIRFKPFNVLENDKNLGFSLVSHDRYKELCFKHLNDSNSYLKIENNPLNKSIDDINKCLHNLLINNLISHKIFDCLVILNKVKLGKFRVLPKLHKDKFSTRPIINCKNHITEKLCILVDLVIKPIVQNILHILKDSQQLLQQLENKYINKKPFIYSGDFESLYTNMEPDHVCQIVCEYLKDKLDQTHLSIQGFFLILN